MRPAITFFNIQLSNSRAAPLVHMGTYPVVANNDKIRYNIGVTLLLRGKENNIERKKRF